MLSCSLCGGWLQLLGSLGRLTWFRCRNCGMDVNIPTSEVDID